MVGAIPADIVMHRRPVGRGYVHLRETGRGPWARAAAGPQTIRAHEFHYSSVENLAPGVEFAYEVERGHGIDGRHDGIVHRNLLASYAHLRAVEGNPWARRFVDFIRRLQACSLTLKRSRCPPAMKGYLVDPSDWSREWALEIARREGIELTDDHWAVIRFVREFYEERHVIPDARFVIEVPCRHPQRREATTCSSSFPTAT